jgi:hydroxyacylglutathione hydrolase
LTTHHHWDHAGGNDKLLKKQPGLTVYGGSDQVQAVTHVITTEDATLTFGSLTIQPYLTRGHTMEHICYYIQDGDNRAVFTGDCLFSSGCGRFFEGTPTDMDGALTKLKTLPGSTKVYFGHEYTVANCRFALTVEPQNADLQQKLAWAHRVGCTTPSSIENENLTVRKGGRVV